MEKKFIKNQKAYCDSLLFPKCRNYAKWPRRNLSFLLFKTLLINYFIFNGNILDINESVMLPSDFEERAISLFAL